MGAISSRDVSPFAALAGYREVGGTGIVTSGDGLLAAFAEDVDLMLGRKLVELRQQDNLGAGDLDDILLVQ